MRTNETPETGIWKVMMAGMKGGVGESSREKATYTDRGGNPRGQHHICLDVIRWNFAKTDAGYVIPEVRGKTCVYDLSEVRSNLGKWNFRRSNGTSCLVEFAADMPEVQHWPPAK